MVKDGNKEDAKERISQNYELVPPDGGYGIAVAFAISVMYAVTLAPMAAFGLIYGSFLASIGDETSGTTIVNGLFNTVYSFTGLAANQLLQKTSYRKVGLLGAVFYFGGSFATIFVTSLFQMIVSFGILQGLGFGLMMPAIFTAFNHYFDKRKNVAMSIAQTLFISVVIGFPALVRYLLDEYGFRGTVALMSAISLNCIPAMACLQPVKWHLKKQPLTLIEMTEGQTLKCNLEIVEGESLLHRHRKSLLEQPRKSLVSIGSTAMSVSNINTRGAHHEVQTLGVWGRLVNVLDLHLFRDPVYVNIVLGISFSLTSDLAFLSVFPLLLINGGFNNQEVTLIMTVFFLADLVSRITLSVLSAIISVRNRYVFLLGALLSAVFRTAFVMNDSLWWMLSVSAALGFLRCFIQTPMPLVIAEAYTQRFVTAFSLFMVVCGFIALLFGPLIALVKDVTQSDKAVVHVLTAAHLLCAIPWILELAYKKFAQRKEMQET